MKNDQTVEEMCAVHSTNVYSTVCIFIINKPNILFILWGQLGFFVTGPDLIDVQI